MTKAKFEIVENKRHTNIVNANPLLKYIITKADGEKVINESHFSSLPKKFQVEVGNTEKHHARAKWKYSNLH